MKMACFGTVVAVAGGTMMMLMMPGEEELTRCYRTAGGEGEARRCEICLVSGIPVATPHNLQT